VSWPCPSSWLSWPLTLRSWGRAHVENGKKGKSRTVEPGELFRFGTALDPDRIGDRDTSIWLMIAALLAGAIWLNFATILGAPVSTTHPVVGGVQ